jgi:RNA polymerase sigma factor (sigma-70 family)
MEDNEFLELIKKDEESGFKVIYERYYGIAMGVMRKNGLNCEYGRDDVFQTSLMVFLITIRKEDFKLNSKVSTYLIGIIKKQTLKYFHNRKQYDTKFTTKVDAEEPIEYVVDENINIVEDLTSNQINGIVRNEINSGSSRLQILDRMYIQEMSHVEIAKELNYSSTDSIKSQKYKAIKSIRKSLVKKYSEKELKYYHND